MNKIIINICSPTHYTTHNDIVYNIEPKYDDDSIFTINLPSWKSRYIFNDYSIDCVYFFRVTNFKYIRDDLLNYMPKIKKGGYMCGIGYDTIQYPDVVLAINDVIGIPDIIFPDNKWVYRIV